LNFKKVPYKTTWVPLLEIPTVRSTFNIPVSRRFADGSPYYTLPVISDPATGRIVGDSFEIAVYLQEQYPSSGHLFPAQNLAYVFGQDLALFAPIAEAEVAEGPITAYARFNTNVDAAFSAHAQLMGTGLPLDPASAEEAKAEFSRRMGGVPVEAMQVSGDARAALLGSFEETLGGLAALYKDTGPFLLGDRASYADFIIGGWLRFCKITLPADEWETLKGWHGGVFGRLQEALQTYAQMD
jgi:glutathione S-transferase